MAPRWPPGRARSRGLNGCCGLRLRQCRSRGATYLGLMFVVATLGLALAAAGALWSTTLRRERETELLFVGQQFSSAITRFHNQTPVGQPARFPRTLDELLDDKRWPTTQRHLRKVFVDPVSGRAQWGLVRAPDGGLMGVHSLSTASPHKRAGFPVGLEGFAGAISYREWTFVLGGLPAGAQPSVPSPASAAAAVRSE